MRVSDAKLIVFRLILRNSLRRLIFFNNRLFIISCAFAIFANVMSNDLDKKYYRIREVAAIVELPASTLRFWESQFTIIKPRRNSKGIRLYTADDVEVIRMIKYLVKDKGLKIEAAQEQIRQNRTNVSRRHEAVKRLQDIRTRLNDLLHSLSSRRQ